MGSPGILSCHDMKLALLVSNSKTLGFHLGLILLFVRGFFFVLLLLEKYLNPFFR